MPTEKNYINTNKVSAKEKLYPILRTTPSDAPDVWSLITLQSDLMGTSTEQHHHCRGS